MTEYKQKSNDDSLNQSESDDVFWLENKIKEQLQQSPNDYNSGALESQGLSRSYSQSEESYKGFEGFETPFFIPPNLNSLPENQPALPPGLGSVDQGFPKDPFAKNKAESQEHSFLLFSEPLNASELFKVPQNQMPKHSRFSHYEPEPVKSSLKSRLKLQSANFQPDHGATPQGEHQNEEFEENEENEENVENAEVENIENKLASKEILDETPENKEKNETPEQEKNPYAEKIISKREIEEKRRKKAAEAEAEAAAKKPKIPEVVVVHTKPADETPNHEHKNEKAESKNTLETPKNTQNKIPKPIVKQEPHSQHQQTKPHLHHENNGVTKQQSFKKEDSFKQATKHKKRASFQQEKEIVEYVEKKNPPSVPSKPKEDIETKPKLAGVNKFNKFEFLIGSQSSASNESNDSLDENLEVNEVKKGSNSPKKSESKSVIPEKDNDQQGSNKKKNKKKQKNKNKTLTSNKDLDSTPKDLDAQKEIKEIEEKVKTPSDEEQSDEEVEKQQNKPSSKSAKNKKKKANKKKKKNASSIQALEDDKEIMKGVHLKGSPDSDLSQISEIEQETLSQNIKKKTFREICEDPRMISSGLLFIPGSNFHDDLIKGMKLIPR